MEIDKRARLSCWQEGDYGDVTVEDKQLRKCLACKALVLVIWGKLGRGRGHTPLVTLRKIGRGRREELMRQNHSGHVVVEAHL